MVVELREAVWVDVLCRQSGPAMLPGKADAQVMALCGGNLE
jgi:hypothetical protein